MEEELRQKDRKTGERENGRTGEGESRAKARGKDKNFTILRGTLDRRTGEREDDGKPRQASGTSNKGLASGEAKGKSGEAKGE